MRYAIALSFLAFVLIACTTPTTETVSVERFAKVSSTNDVFVLDVHTPEQEHIIGTDAFIPYDQLRENADKLPSKDTPIALYCRSGSMSAEAMETLKEMGYTTVYNLDGGTNAWREAGLPFQEKQLSGGESDLMTVYKSPTCGCCGIWTRYIDKEGYENNVVQMQDLSGIKQQYGIPATLESCHTTVIGGYFVEGHIPSEAIDKLLAERPDIKGIAMPGMPSGSPGMPGAKTGPFVIYAVHNDGSTSEFMRI